DEPAQAAAVGRALPRPGAAGGGNHFPHPPRGECARSVHSAGGAERPFGAESRRPRLRAGDGRGGDGGPRARAVGQSGNSARLLGRVKKQGAPTAPTSGEGERTMGSAWRGSLKPLHLFP